MVAVELINRIQNYRSEDGKIRTFTDLPIKEAEKLINELTIEISELITMINDALRNVSISHSYAVPYISVDGLYYAIKTKNFTDEVKKKRDKQSNAKKDEDKTASAITALTSKQNKIIIPSVIPTIPTIVVPANEYPDTDDDDELNSITEHDTNIDNTITVPTVPTVPTVRRRRPVVALAEDNLAAVLGEDADLQAAIAASLKN